MFPSILDVSTIFSIGILCCCKSWLLAGGLLFCCAPVPEREQTYAARSSPSVMPCGLPTLQWNPVADSSFERPSNNAVHRFLDVLQAAGIPASTRITRGAPPVMDRQPWVFKWEQRGHTTSDPPVEPGRAPVA